MSITSPETKAAPSARRTTVLIAMAVIAALLPLALAFAFPHARFGGDWDVHVWMTGYFSEYFKQHHEMPACLNTDVMSGIVYPVFYGYLLFPILGAFGWMTGAGADWTTRLAFATLWLVQFGAVYATGMKYTQSTFRSMVLACVVSWAAYPFTNLYTRGDFTELAATLLLVIGTCFWLVALKADARMSRTALITAAGLAWTVCVGAHPITGLYALVFLCVFVPLTLWSVRTPAAGAVGMLATLAVLAGASALVLAPWIYALLTHMKDVRITAVEIGNQVAIFSKNIDAVSSRFAPLPLNPGRGGWAAVNYPLLLWIVCMAGASIRPSVLRAHGKNLLFFATAVLFFAIYSMLSLSHWLYGYLPSWFTIVQFGYRLVTFQNLCLLMSLVALFSMTTTARATPRRFERALLFTCLMLSVSGLIIKVVHGYRVMKNEPLPGAGLERLDRDALAILPEALRGHNLFEYEYREGALYRTDPKVHVATYLSFPIGTGRAFGRIQPLAVDLHQAAKVAVNLYQFPWLRLRLDGRLVEVAECTVPGWTHIALGVPPGVHEIRAEFMPDPTWLGLRSISSCGLALWGVMLAGLATWVFVAPRRSQRQELALPNEEAGRRSHRLAA